MPITDETLEQAQARADRAQADLQELLAVLSHDLGAPVRHIVGFGALLQRANLEAASPSARRNAERMIGAGNRIQGMLDALLVLSCVESRGQPMEPFEPAVALESVIAQARARAEAAGGTLVTEPLPPMRGDAAQIAQLVACLLDNCLNFARADAPPAVRVLAGTQGDVAQLTVEDNGVGLDVSRFPKMLLPFRVGVPDRSPGPGMGLAIAHRIARRHGAELQVRSELGVGTTISVALPLVGAAR